MDTPRFRIRSYGESWKAIYPSWPPRLKSSSKRVKGCPADDQKRVVTVEQVLRNAADPYEAAMQIQGTIEGLFLSG